MIARRPLQPGFIAGPGIWPGLLLLLSVLYLSGCASWNAGASRSEWPADIPPRSEFEARYDADAGNQTVQTREEYLRWVKRFYTGWHLYADGWSDLVPEVLSEVENPQVKARLQDQLYRMGETIAGEWAKESKERRIYTKHLSVWGNALRDAMVRGETPAMIHQIARDLDRLMAERLAISEIKAGRYYPLDENDVFAP